MAINTDTVLISHDEIEQMLDRVSAELNRDYKGEPLVVVGILTGAFIFTADLVRRLEMPVIVDFMQVSSYVGEFSTGELKIKKDMSYDIKDMNVLIVEDIIDTGRTLALLKEKLLETEDEYLEEGNTWGDKVWGTVNGVGANNLGRILMEVREILQERELDHEREEN